MLASHLTRRGKFLMNNALTFKKDVSMLLMSVLASPAFLRCGQDGLLHIEDCC